MVMGLSEAAPEEGETETQESEEVTVQFRFAENVRVELPPSAFKSILDGPEYINSGSFWHDHRIPIAKMKVTMKWRKCFMFEWKDG